MRDDVMGDDEIEDDVKGNVVMGIKYDVMRDDVVMGMMGMMKMERITMMQMQPCARCDHLIADKSPHHHRQTYHPDSGYILDTYRLRVR